MTTSAPHSALEKLVKNFGLFPKQMKILEQERLLVLELRARGGSYPQIRQVLATVGIQVSDASLSKFCCKHRAEIDRLQIEMEGEGEGASPQPLQPPRQAPSLSPTSPSTQITPLPLQKKIRDLRGPV
jgi:hypothetical protein